MRSYPAVGAERDRFVVDLRGPRPRHDAWRYHDVSVEDERDADGQVARVATVFLTGRECPWRCVMCDLWRHTIEDDTPARAIPSQVKAARRVLDERGDAVTQMKLYNAGSFFDPRAVPEADYGAVAAALAGLDRVIVESHPSLVGPRVDRLLEALDAPLEVAMGLETAHPEALERLHKRMSVETFAAAASRLAERGVALRVFLLISPPFVPPDEQDAWLLRSIERAFSSGASVVSLIPTRPGNGAMESLAAQGHFRPPEMHDIERSVEIALANMPPRGRIFVDLWDLEQFTECPHCTAGRRARLHRINLEQRALPAFSCDQCMSMPT